MESILRATINFKIEAEKMRVLDAKIPVRKHPLSTEFNEVLDDLVSEQAIVIVDDKGRIAGIVTDNDSASYFRRRAEGLILIDDIEASLRDYVGLAFQGEYEATFESAIQQVKISEQDFSQFKKAIVMYLSQSGEDTSKFSKDAAEKAHSVLIANKDLPKSVDELSLSEIIGMLLNKERWHRYSEAITLEKAAIKRMLDAVRVIRNKVAHFKGDLTYGEQKLLEDCKRWLANHQEALRNAFRIEQPPEIIQVEEENSASNDKSQSLGYSHVDYFPVSSLFRSDKLKDYLEELGPGTDHVWISLPQLEAINGMCLPEAAYLHRSWWSNHLDKPQSKGWTGAGFMVAEVDFDRKMVRFQRQTETQKVILALLQDQE